MKIRQESGALARLRGHSEKRRGVRTNVRMNTELGATWARVREREDVDSEGSIFCGKILCGKKPEPRIMDESLGSALMRSGEHRVVEGGGDGEKDQNRTSARYAPRPCKP